MSKLSDLIADFCPTGVQYYSINVTPSFKVKIIDNKENGSTPIISQEAEFISGYSELEDENIPDRNFVCFGDHSEHVKYVDFAFVQGADGLKIMYSNEEVVITRYLFHAITSLYVKHNNYERHFKYLCETIIPAPPLEVQREIVRILDNFTELTARKKQYEYYRDRLFSFDKTRGVIRANCWICFASQLQMHPILYQRLLSLESRFYPRNPVNAQVL